MFAPASEDCWPSDHTRSPSRASDPSSSITCGHTGRPDPAETLANVDCILNRLDAIAKTQAEQRELLNAFEQRQAVLISTAYSSGSVAAKPVVRRVQHQDVSPNSGYVEVCSSEAQRQLSCHSQHRRTTRRATSWTWDPQFQDTLDVNFKVSGAGTYAARLLGIQALLACLTTPGSPVAILMTLGHVYCRRCVHQVWHWENPTAHDWPILKHRVGMACQRKPVSTMLRQI